MPTVPQFTPSSPGTGLRWPPRVRCPRPQACAERVLGAVPGGWTPRCPSPQMATWGSRKVEPVTTWQAAHDSALPTSPPTTSMDLVNHCPPACAPQPAARAGTALGIGSKTARPQDLVAERGAKGRALRPEGHWTLEGLPRNNLSVLHAGGCPRPAGPGGKRVLGPGCSAQTPAAPVL